MRVIETCESPVNLRKSPIEACESPVNPWKSPIAFWKKRRMMAVIRNKKIWFLLIVVVIWLIWFYTRPLITFDEAVSSLDIASINHVLISDMRESYYIEQEEIEQFISILNSLFMKKKIIPNRPAFNEDAYIYFNSKNSEVSYTIILDYERNIIGIIESPKMMKQYILEDSSELFTFVKSYVSNNEVVE